MTTTSTIPIMKAATISEYGTQYSKICKIVSNFPTPQAKDLKPNQVLVHVAAAGINPADVHLASGIISFLFPLQFPCILGNDVAGTVVAMGSKVKRFKIGDQVAGTKVLGAHAEYAVYEEQKLAHVPASLSAEEAASMPVALLTAYQSLLSITPTVQFDQESCLILGASGGVGSFLTLFAKHFFKYKQVYATCSAKNADYVKSLGADHVIDYATQDYAQVLQGKQLLAVFSTIGEYPDKCAQILKPANQHGAFVSIGGPPYLMQGGVWNMMRFAGHIASNKLWALFNYPHFNNIMADENGEQLEMAMQWLVANKMLGKVRTIIFNLDDACKAYEMVHSKRTVGKLVFKI